MFVRSLQRFVIKRLASCIAERVIIIRSARRVVQVRFGRRLNFAILVLLALGIAVVSDFLQRMHEQNQALTAHVDALADAKSDYQKLFFEFARHQSDIRKVSLRLREDVSTLESWLAVDSDASNDIRIQRTLGNLLEIHNGLSVNSYHVSTRVAMLGERFLSRSRANGLSDSTNQKSGEKLKLGGSFHEFAETQIHVRELGELVDGLRMAQGKADAVAERSVLGRLSALRDAVSVTEKREQEAQQKIQSLEARIRTVQQESAKQITELSLRETHRRESELAALQGKLTSLRSNRDRIHTNRIRIARRLSLAEKDNVYLREQRKRLEQNIARNHLQLRSLEGRLAVASGTLLDTRKKLTSTTTKLDTVGSDAKKLASRLSSLESQLTTSKKDLSGLTNVHSKLLTKNENLEQSLGSLNTSYVQLMQKFASQTKADLNAMEVALRKTGLNLNKMMRRVLNSGQKNKKGIGGPFVAWLNGGGTGTNSPESKQDAASLLNYLNRWEGMNRLVRVLPLGSPLARTTIVSRYGRRIDPINKKPAMHLGVDMRAATGKPVRTTAGGVITFSGWKGSFGRLIMIDHGYGIRTRYGHLSKLKVKVGQKVAPGEVIGAAGNSGRSTGSHLHYEVQIGGRSHNPAHFIKAGANVLKNISR